MCFVRARLRTLPLLGQAPPCELAGKKRTRGLRSSNIYEILSNIMLVLGKCLKNVIEMNQMLSDVSERLINVNVNVSQ